MNLFEQAVNKRQLIKFAKGESKYFIHDKKYGDHFVYGSWAYQILPFIKGLEETDTKNYVEDFFKSILKENMGVIPKIDLLLHHLHTYYYLLFEKRIDKDWLTEYSKTIEGKVSELLTKVKTTDEDQYKLAVSTIEGIQKRGGLSSLEIV